jgi:Carboxypeptidase regulatory-like domain
VARTSTVRFVLSAAVCAVALGTVPAGATAGSISGKVTAADGGALIAGVRVCQYEPSGAIEESCTQSDGNGDYAFGGLPAGSYRISFSGWLGNLKWVDELYDDKRTFGEANLVTIGASEARGGIDAALAEGGSIAGTVSDETTEQPVAGVRVCAIGPQGTPGRCAESGSGGAYQINGLSSGVYNVEFEGGNNANYLREFYEDAGIWAAATEVTVTAPATTAGIDAALSPGAQILGRVTEVGAGAPLEDVMVCAMEADPGGYEACDWTDPNGEYAIRSLPAGTYLVAFGREFLPFGVSVGQWWNGASSAAEATPIAIAPPETRAGIDGQVPGPFRGSSPEGVAVAISSQSVTPPAACPKGTQRRNVAGGSRCVRKRAPKCRKGFRRKKAKGKSRCVKKKSARAQTRGGSRR